MSRVIFHESSGVKLDYLESRTENPGSGTFHTFTGVNLGPASSSGLLVIGASAIGALSGPTGLLVDGNSATLVVSSVNQYGCAIYSMTGVSGIGDVTVISANAANTYHIGLYKLRGVQNPVVHDFDTVTSGPLSFDVPKLGAAIAFVSINTTPATTAWTGLQEDFDNLGASASVFSGASGVFDTAQAPLNVSTNSFSFARYVGASWR